MRGGSLQVSCQNHTPSCTFRFEVFPLPGKSIPSRTERSHRRGCRYTEGSLSMFVYFVKVCFCVVSSNKVGLYQGLCPGSSSPTSAQQYRFAVCFPPPSLALCSWGSMREEVSLYFLLRKCTVCRISCVW